jgi:hypothetical protein
MRNKRFWVPGPEYKKINIFRSKRNICNLIRVEWIRNCAGTGPDPVYKPFTVKCRNVGSAACAYNQFDTFEKSKKDLMGL